jgi:hypothetical protein
LNVPLLEAVVGAAEAEEHEAQEENGTDDEEDFEFPQGLRNRRHRLWLQTMRRQIKKVLEKIHNSTKTLNSKLPMQEHLNFCVVLLILFSKSSLMQKNVDFILQRVKYAY